MFTVPRFNARQRFFLANRQLLRTKCLGCQCFSSSIICRACRYGLKKPDFHCITCGQGLTGAVSVLRCRECIEMPTAIEAMDFVSNYEGLIAQLMVAAKLAYRVEAVAALQQLLREYLVEDKHGNGHSMIASTRQVSPLQDYWQADYALLPMPIPRWRLMQRGFNLPLLFAKVLASHFDLPMISSGAVTLPVKTQKQGVLSRQQRLKNHRIYQFHHKLPDKIIVVDDIFTTGQSVNDLAGQLRSDGVESVAVWVFSRGLND